MKQLKTCSDEAKAKETEEERCISVLEAKQSRLAQIATELSQMKADLLRLISEVRTDTWCRGLWRIGERQAPATTPDK
jgi:hypothetical protein